MLVGLTASPSTVDIGLKRLVRADDAKVPPSKSNRGESQDSTWLPNAKRFIPYDRCRFSRLLLCESIQSQCC